MASFAPLLLPIFLLFSSVFAAPTIGKGLLSGVRFGAREDAVRLLYQYPVGTWIENIAVRENGELLLTLLTAPHVDRLNPLEPEPQVETVYTFLESTSVAGIAEIEQDVFAVAVGNASVARGPVAGSWSIWNVAFQKSFDDSAMVKKIADIPGFVLPDGMVALPSDSKPLNVLISDVNRDGIYHIDSTTGESSLVIDNDLTKVVPDLIFGMAGVNGLKLQEGILYFTNTGLGTFARIPINIHGTPLAEPEPITHVSNSSLQYDDFVLRGHQAYLVTGSGNSVERVNLQDTSDREIIAGSLNSVDIAGPTAAAFGRTELDKHVLYVVTTGGIAAPVNGGMTVGAQVLAIDTLKL